VHESTKFTPHELVFGKTERNFLVGRLQFGFLSRNNFCYFYRTYQRRPCSRRVRTIRGTAVVSLTRVIELPFPAFLDFMSCIFAVSASYRRLVIALTSACIVTLNGFVIISESSLVPRIFLPLITPNFSRRGVVISRCRLWETSERRLGASRRQVSERE